LDWNSADRINIMYYLCLQMNINIYTKKRKKKKKRWFSNHIKSYFLHGKISCG
jgi:hypothetical protein